MLKYLINAYRGYFVWRKIIRTNQMGINDFVLALDDDADCNSAAFKYLKIFKEENKIDKIILVTAHEKTAQIAASFNTSNVQVISQKEWQSFVDFFTVFTKEGRIRIISLKNPFGRNARSIIGLKGLTVEEIVCIGMLGLNPKHFTQAKEND